MNKKTTTTKHLNNKLRSYTAENVPTWSWCQNDRKPDRSTGDTPKNLPVSGRILLRIVACRKDKLLHFVKIKCGHMSTHRERCYCRRNIDYVSTKHYIKLPRLWTVARSTATFRDATAIIATTLVKIFNAALSEYVLGSNTSLGILPWFELVVGPIQLCNRNSPIWFNRVKIWRL